MSKAILLTGAAGFIGSALRSKLEKIYTLTGLTRTTLSEETQDSNLLHVDLGDDQFTTRLPSEVDCIVHLAQSREYRNFPDGANDMRIINIDSTCKLLEWARKTGVKKFIYASTANVYGQSTELLTETHQTAPISFYGASKLAAEHLIKQYQQFFQVDILRLFTVYGPGQREMLIPNIIERITSSNPITLAEGVGIYLSPIFVGDVVDIISRLIITPSRQQSRLMNVCGDQVVSLSEIVRILENIIGNRAVIKMTCEEATHLRGSNERLKNYLDTSQFVDIQIGLENVVRPTKLFH